MATYNRPYFLQEAIDSILVQTLKNFELMIVDDGSQTQETAEICSHYKAMDQRVKYLWQPHAGLSAARNHGVQKTDGEFIAIMDDDDISHPMRLEKQVDFIKRNPHIAAVNCNCYGINELGEITKDTPVENIPLIQDKNPPLQNAVVRHQKIIMAQTTVVRRDIYIEAGGFDTTFKIMEDRDFTLRLEEKYTLANLGEGLYFYRTHSQGNLCRHQLTWHYFCNAYVRAYFRRQNTPAPTVCEPQDMLLHLHELPPQLLHDCASYAYGLARNFLQTKSYAVLEFLLTDFNTVFRSKASCRLKINMYLRVLLWSVRYVKLGGLILMLKHALR